MQTKKCACCGLELPTTEFYESKKKRDGLQSYCKKCAKELSNKSYHSKINKPIGGGVMSC